MQLCAVQTCFYKCSFCVFFLIFASFLFLCDGLVWSLSSSFEWLVLGCIGSVSNEFVLSDPNMHIENDIALLNLIDIANTSQCHAFFVYSGDFARGWGFLEDDMNA